MPVSIMLAVLGGAFLHAAWNIIAKSGHDKDTELGGILIGGAAVSAVLLLVLPLPALRSLPFMVSSGVIHVGYISLLAAAYRVGDLSLAYPIMRGVPPLIVAAVSIVWFRESLPPASIIGIALVSAGVLGLAAHRSEKPAASAVIGFALLNCIVIALYTMVDATGARLSGAPFAYTLGVFIANALFYTPLLLWRRGLGALGRIRARWTMGLGGGVCSLGSYGVALWAYAHTAVGPVAALRETSILFGIVLSMLILGERPGMRRIVSAILIMGGVVALRLA